MSYFEYKDLKEKAEKNINCKYQLFYLDINNSKQELNILLQYKYKKLLAKIKIDLLVLEKEKNNKILVNNENMSNLKFDRKLLNSDILFGDLMYFCVYNKSITLQEFENIVKKNMEKVNFNNSLHFGVMNFETTQINKSNKLFYVGDAISFANNEKSNYISISLDENVN